MYPMGMTKEDFDDHVLIDDDEMDEGEADPDDAREAELDRFAEALLEADA